MQALLHIYEQLLDACFPPSDDARMVRRMTFDNVRALYHPTVDKGVWALSSYSHPEMHALIHEAKFHGNTRATELLGHLLALFIADHPSYAHAAWVPVPLSRARHRARGFNQSERVLRATKLSPPLTIHTALLKRSVHTRPQTDLSREERLKNVSGAFTLSDELFPRDQDIVVFDDVVTTGATLRAAETALRAYHPRTLTLVALSH